MSNMKKEMMSTFWSERAKLYGSDPRANTNDIWLREIEVGYVDRVIQCHSFQTILDFGCANGFTTYKLAKLHTKTHFVGIDINEDMIRIAKSHGQVEGLPNVDFKRCDVQREIIAERFDFIYAIRVFQNMESQRTQKSVFDTLRGLLQPGGFFLCVESYLDGYTRLNADREDMGLPPLPIHDHLTLLTDKFDDYADSKMKLIKRDSLSSTYYLVTRLLYSYISKMCNEPINYNHPIHQVAAMIPQIGEYGPQRASLYQKI